MILQSSVFFTARFYYLKAMQLPNKISEISASLKPYHSIIENLSFPMERIDILEQYIFRLCLANQELNLVSRKMTFKDLIENHIIDCLMALPGLDKEIRTIADLGTGGGLPAIIFAIARPNQKFLLFEKSNLKRNFLDSLQDICPNIQSFENITNDIDCDLIIARAFKPIDVIIALSPKYFSRSGKYYLLKAKTETILEEIKTTKPKLKEQDYQIEALKHPLLSVERNIVHIKKS